VIRSMTGFGDASCEVDGVHYAVELRSVNNRYFKATIRLPEALTGLEAELETRLRQMITRGSVLLNASLRQNQSVEGYEINRPMLQMYLDALHRLREDQIGSDPPVSVDLAQLLNLPGVVQPPSNTALIEAARPVLLQLIGQAVDKLNTMRCAEGRTIENDLMRHHAYIAERLERIGAHAPQVIEMYHQRLKARVEELLARAELNVPEIDLIREVAVYAERSDIAEEIQRLGAHLDQMKQVIASDDGEPAGRTLDFITQELLREANTIASKSNDASISRIIVEVKGAIDRIKEQVQNVE